MTLHQLPLASKDKVIIVGAGIGGLASSVRLSHLGYQVSVFEKAKNAGGKLRTIMGSTGDIDVGPTVLTQFLKNCLNQLVRIFLSTSNWYDKK